MTSDVHWATPANWTEARALVAFEPRVPTSAAGRRLEGLTVRIRDHKQRDVALADRTLQASYAGFGFSQSRQGIDAARRAALEVAYGSHPRPTDVAGHAGRMYEAGPVPAADDIDGRMPAVVTWHDGEMFYFLSSLELAPGDLLVIARSIYV